MFKDLSGLFLFHCKREIDMRLVNDINLFKMSWVQKSDEYISFLGSNLLGIHNVRFSALDDKRLVTELLGIDLVELTKDLNGVKGINKDWNVTSNPVYHVIIYLMHMITISSLPMDVKHKVLQDLYSIFCYKAISSTLSHYFKFNPPESVAKATLEKLTKKSLIKRLNNWQEVFDHLSQAVLPPHGLHSKRLTTYKTLDAMYIISDAHTRIKAIVKNIYGVMVDVMKSNERVISVSQTVETEDGEGLVDKTTTADRYSTNILRIANLANNFIDDDIVYLIHRQYPKLDKNKFLTVLERFADDGLPKKNELIKLVVEDSIGYLRTRGIIGDYNKQIFPILKFLKGFYTKTSPRYRTAEIKTAFTDFVVKDMGIRTHWLVTNIVTGLMIYIFLKSIWKR